MATCCCLFVNLTVCPMILAFTSLNLHRTLAGCDCLAGFSGPVCEYEENKEPECSLECQNGGVCKKGDRYFSNVTQNPELSFLDAFDNDTIEHCLCKSGFAGAHCETEIEVCGDDNHVCLHGSKCLEEEDGSYRCDCESAFTTESRYAGKFCQHHHTDVCTPSGHFLFDGTANDMPFCVNDGVVRPLQHAYHVISSCIGFVKEGALNTSLLSTFLSVPAPRSSRVRLPL